MTSLRFRQLDWEDWTEVSFEGPEAESAAQVLGGWLLAQEFEAEVWDEDEWIPLGEE